MRFTKEFIDAQKQTITHGSILLLDCAVTTTFANSAPASDLDAIQQRINALQVKIEEAAALVRRSRT